MIDSAPGRHPISQALKEVYAALAPIERACAWYEACDSGASYPTMKLQDQMPSLKKAIDTLGSIYNQDRELITEILRKDRD